MYKNKKIWDVICRNKTLNPEFIILTDSEGSYTWKQLFDLVEMHKMKSINGEHELIFYSDKNVNSVAVMLSCIMQKKTFIPVSREQPNERLNLILKSLNHNKIYEPTTTSFVEFPVDDSATEVLNGHQSKESAFYILFTSGSTGVPKGVKISESNVINTLEWGEKTFFWNSDDIIGIVTAFHFDISLFDLFTGLTKSIRLHIFADNANPKKVCQEIFQYKVTSIFSTPSIFGLVAKLNDASLINKTRLRRIISGGDFFPPSDVIYWYTNFKNVELFNVWGPTETTIINTAHKITKSDIDRLHSQKSISIGTSSKEMQIIICEPETSPLNIIKDEKKVGEIVVVGDSVGLGYLGTNKEAQASYTSVKGKRAYRTGDLGFIEDTQIYLVGRSSNLIKYQGYRIDPREVESHLLGQLGIRNCCLVLAANSISSPNLTLLIELFLESSCTVAQIKNILRSKLPKYMIPKNVIFIEKLPVNTNGKIDRRMCTLLAESQIEK